jgi:hypothetical protein
MRKLRHILEKMIELNEIYRYFTGPIRLKTDSKLVYIISEIYMYPFTGLSNLKLDNIAHIAS